MLKRELKFNHLVSYFCNSSSTKILLYFIISSDGCKPSDKRGLFQSSHIQQARVEWMFYEKRPQNLSLRASSPIWAIETSVARTRERAAKPPSAPSLARSPKARFACPNRRACSHANKISLNLPDLITGKDKGLSLFTCHTSIKTVNTRTDSPGLDEWKIKTL